MNPMTNINNILTVVGFREVFTLPMYSMRICTDCMRNLHGLLIPKMAGIYGVSVHID